MKKVALLGDSIRMLGYGAAVPELLGADYNVWQPDENCRYAQHLLRVLFDYKDILKDCDIIHWNCGHWDLCRLFEDGETFTPVEIYKGQLERIGKILLSCTDKVIFSLTTPVWDEYAYNDNPTIDEFNRAAAEALEPLGIVINDLNGPLRRDVKNYICGDMIHLSPAGISLAAANICDAIRKIG